MIFLFFIKACFSNYDKFLLRKKTHKIKHIFLNKEEIMNKEMKFLLRDAFYLP